MKHKRKQTEKEVNDKQYKLMTTTTTTTTVLSILIISLFQATLVSTFSLSRYPILSSPSSLSSLIHGTPQPPSSLNGWVQNNNGEWDWEEDDPSFISPTTTTTSSSSSSSGLSELTQKSRHPSSRMEDKSAPKLPSGSFRPKQSLGQNYLKDGNTIGKIIRAFAQDVDHCRRSQSNNNVVHDEQQQQQHHHPLIIELGPGAGALTTPLLNAFGSSHLYCIEIDQRSVELLTTKHPSLRIKHDDVLQVDYPALRASLATETAAAAAEAPPLSLIGNLPYYITSQILFALADAAHEGCVGSATVTMQWEVARRVVADSGCKDYGILSVVFQLYTTPRIHFKIPPTVFYPQPKVDSALLSLLFHSPRQLRQRLGGVRPRDLKEVLTRSFQQRRKTLRRSLRNLVLELRRNGDDGDGDDDEGMVMKRVFDDAPRPLSESVKMLIGDDYAFGDYFSVEGRMLPLDWETKRPEELHPGQLVEVTRLIYGPWEIEERGEDGGETRVWRKMKHGKY